MVQSRSAARGIAAAGLVPTPTEELCITRIGRGRGFAYLDRDGRPLRDAATLARIRALAIPPAYRDVRIAEDPRAHLQAVGRDEAGRLQYRYHPDWDAVRERRKAKRLLRTTEALPSIRAAVRRHLAAGRDDRQTALACAVALIDATHIRVGCEAYARAAGGRGAATLLKRDVSLAGSTIELKFRGKGGRDIAGTIDHARLAAALERLARLPGRRLLQFRRPGERPGRITSSDINGYLRQVAGAAVTAKDLRMLAGSAAAAEELARIEPAPSASGQRRQLAAVMRRVSAELGNTPAVARKSYVHALVVESFASGALRKIHRSGRRGRGLKHVENTLKRLAKRAQSRRRAREAAAEGGAPA